MVCKSCGEKPKNTAKDFTKAVIEINNPPEISVLRKVVIPASMGTEEQVPPAVGKYRNVLLQYEANDHIYLYSSDGIPTAITANIPQEVLDSIAELEGETVDLQQQIDDLKNSPDVVDIVDTYADLQAYDTSHLGDKDIIRVLTDETHDGASSYYRWDKQTEIWTYIGSIQTAANTIFYANLSETGNTRHIYKNSDMTGTVSVQELLDANEDGQVILRMSSAQTPENFNDAYLQNTYVGVSDYQFLFLDNRNYYEYDASTTTDTSYYYSKSTIQLELTAGNNITITGNTISATDTTYSAFTGTDGQTAGTAGLVPAPATTDAGKFLKADGTWDTAGGGGPTVVQTTGTSTTDVMSQNSVSSMIFADPGTDIKIKIGAGASVSSQNYNMAIGGNADANGVQSTAVGYNAKAQANGIAVGYNAQAGTTISQTNTVAIGESTYGGGDHGVAIGASANAINSYSTAVGSSTRARSERSVAIGASAWVENSPAMAYSVALGANAVTTRAGEVNIGTGANNYGYNSTPYRVIGGVHDPVDTHDAATKGYVDTVASVITMTDTDPGEGAPLDENHYIGVYDEPPIILDYATVEINTGTRWITGDIIYKRTVSLGALPNATTATVAHNISNFDTLVKLEGVFTNGTNSGSIPYASPTATKSIQAYVDATNITIVTGEDRSGFTGYATIYYTKTTNPV